MRWFILAATAATALASTGCGSVTSGVHEADLDFQVIPRSNGTFFRWNEFTSAEATTSITRATILSATLDVEAPEGTPDLSFIKSITGEAVNDAGRTLVVSSSNFPPGEQAVILDVKYHDDIRPLFKDPQTLRIEWNGATNPAFTGSWPPDGFTVRGRVKIDVE